MFERGRSLEVRLARTPVDIAACQHLRYQVFAEEMGGLTGPAREIGRLDTDRFDAIADHLMVVDRTAPQGPLVVGTYRFLRQEIAEAHGGFYTAQEYDLAPMLARAPSGTRFLELGRSCVHPNYRTRPTINMLWKGIGYYVALHDIDVLFGCASFPGTDPEAHALALSFLASQFRLPEPWLVRALPERYLPMARIPADEIDEQEAFRALPAMIRGYVRAGCRFGDGAVIDAEFGSVDVLVMSIIADVKDSYFARFGASG